MHLRIAQGLEQQPAVKIEKNAGAIAHHFYQAGAGADPEKTVHYLMLAADRANDALAFEDAVKYLDSAIDIVPELGNDTHARLLSRKAVSLQGSELVEESIACLHDAVEVADSIDLEDELILQRCKMLLDIWRGHEAVEDLEKLLTRAKTGSDRHKELEAQRWMGRAYYVMSLDRSGFTEKTRDSYNNTIALGRELGEMEIVGKTLVQTAQLLDYWPEYLGEVKKNLEEADRISREIDNDDISIDVATMRLAPQLYLEEYEFGEAVLEKLLTRRDPVRLNAHYFRMMWSSLAAGRLERCVEICSDGAALAYRIGTLPVQYPSIKAMALMELGRLDEAWQSIEEEIADEDHRFGAALQELGKFQFELNCGATEAAIARAPHVISEAKFLSRMWMLSWVSSSLAFAQVWTEDDTRIEVLNRLIQDTGMSPRTIGKSAIKLASGAAKDVIFELKAIVNGPDRPMEVRNKSQAMLLLGLALVKQGDLKEAVEVTSDGVELCEQHQLRQTLWQIKALQANILDSLGDEESAMNLSKSVRVLRQEIEATIDIPEYLSSFKKNDTLNTLKL
jgi:tetratricopeptide (TPR) repeat protein